jgi:DNA-binding transcriptional MerR regulator/methylmalonyl-CoA mutase cobalamin-binding subunit
VPTASSRRQTGVDISLEPRHPVRVVAERTGLSPAALRAWERRYGAVKPGRTEGSQRLYSDVDVDRLRLIARLSAEGHALSELAKRPLDTLRQLAVTAVSSATDAPAFPKNENAIVRELLRATSALDTAALRRTLSQALLQTGHVAALDAVISPFLRAVGDAWACGDTGVAYEHLATSIVRDALGAMLQSAVPAADAPLLVAGTLSGELHELGALMAAIVAAANRLRVLYLGPNLPAAEFVRAAKDARPRVVCIGITDIEELQPVRAEISQLRRGLGTKTTVVAGGAGTDEHRLSLRRARVKVVANRAELRTLLDNLWTRAS